jgi:hypothetical protein
MNAMYPLSIYRRIERQWVERINSLSRIRSQIVVATERMLQRAFPNNGSLIPIPVRANGGRRRLDQSRPQ